MYAVLKVSGSRKLTANDVRRPTTHSWGWVSRSLGQRQSVSKSLPLESADQHTDVQPVHKEIVKVVTEGLLDDGGTLHKADILVCATGFNLAFVPPFEVRGRDGVSMADEFNPDPFVYLAVTVPKFPNYFVVNGPRGNWANGSALPTHEVQVEYILQCVKRMQAEDIRAMEVKLEPIKQLYEHIGRFSSLWQLVQYFRLCTYLTGDADFDGDRRMAQGFSLESGLQEVNILVLPK